MSNLAQKYRPSTFDDVVEQGLVVDILHKLCVDSDMNGRNFLLIGPAGTGKTTLGRIMSSTINGGVGEPVEMDAASHGGVEDVRKLIEQSRTYPIDSKYKIFIIDECHSLSSSSWQALLKTLEENPAKTIFIFLTTNPEKIPATILSRVQTFQLSKISVDGIIGRLKYVIDQENAEGRHITYTEDAISYIAKLSGGGMRDSLTLLDKALAYSENLTSETLMKSLNLPNYDDYFALLAAYAKHDNASITKIINKVYNSGVNFIKWIEGFHSFVTNVTKYIFMQDITATMIPAHYKDKVSNYGVKHSIICMKLSNMLLKLISDLKLTPYLQEVTLTYLCVPVPVQKKETTNVQS